MVSSQPNLAPKKEPEDASDDEDLEEEMAAYNPLPDSFGVDDGSSTLADPSEAERRQETKEERASNNFLTDPERALKIFFTSYFIDKGLMW